MVWVTFRGTRSHVFKRSYAMQLNDERFRSKSSSTQPSFQMIICFRSSPILSHLLKVKEKSSYSTSLSEYHRLSRFAREMGASPSLDRVTVSTRIKFSEGFNTYKTIKTHVEEAIKYYKSWQIDKSNLISNAYPASTLLDASSRFFSSISIFF